MFILNFKKPIILRHVEAFVMQTGLALEAIGTNDNYLLPLKM